jgi:hypothetical protein
MRKHLITTLALAAVAAVAVAGIAVAAKPTIVQVGTLKLTLNGDFTPKALPKSGKPAPITLNVSGKIETTDGTHPPAAKEFVVETDKNGSIDVKGLPKCTSGKLQAQDTKNAEKICPKAIIGEGKTDVEVEFPESAPFIAKSKLLAFNGGFSGGKTTILIHAYLSSPVSAAVVTTVKIQKISNGRYGTKSIASIPKIAGGYGSVNNFSLTLDRGFGNTPYLFAKCPDGRLQAKATGVFSDGKRLTGTFVRPCTPKG